MKRKIFLLLGLIMIVLITALIIQSYNFLKAPIIQLYDFPKPYNGTFTVAICKDGVSVKAEWFNGTCIIQSSDFALVIENVTRFLSGKGGGVILIKSGTYLIKYHHTLVWDEPGWTYYVGALIYKPRNINIVGEGKSTVLVADADVSNPLFIYNAYNFSISNLIVDGHLQNRPYYDNYALIQLSGGGVNITVHDLLLQNGAHVGVYVSCSDFQEEISDKEWYCPPYNVTLYNIYTCNTSTGVFLDHAFNCLAYNITSINDWIGIGFTGFDWEPDYKTFENVTIINPKGCAFKGWYPEGRLKNISVYLSRPQVDHLFDFTNASRIEIENIYIYGKPNPNKAIIYTDNKETQIIIKGEIKINPSQ